MDRPFEFFVYLIESYAEHRGREPSSVLEELKKKNCTSFVFDMYEMYHSEAIENAFRDIDALLTTGHPLADDV